MYRVEGNLKFQRGQIKKGDNHSGEQTDVPRNLTSRETFPQGGGLRRVKRRGEFLKKVRTRVRRWDPALLLLWLGAKTKLSQAKATEEVAATYEDERNGSQGTGRIPSFNKDIEFI